MDKTVVIFINYATLGVRSHPSGPKRKYWGCLISSHSASGERAEEPPLPAAGSPSSAGAAGAAGGDAALGATPGLSQSPEPAAGRVHGAPTEPRCPPLPSSSHLGTRSFTHTQTHKQTRSNTSHGPRFFWPPPPHTTARPSLPSDASRSSRTKIHSAEPGTLAEPCSRGGVGVHLLLGEATGMESRKPCRLAPRTFPLPRERCPGGRGGKTLEAFQEANSPSCGVEGGE